ncbi:MAG: hypothetical protein P8O04_00100 [Flavobacteriaceae bacterium]|nr:hypothetical protein [Flavobacteriaceae bacterium]
MHLVKTVFFLCLISCYFCDGYLYAQLESNTPPSKSFPNLAAPEKKSFLLPEPESNFLKKPNPSRLELKKPMLDMTQKEKFIDLGTQYLSRLNRNLKNQSGEDQKLSKDFMIDQYLGDFRSTEKIMQVVVRDHEHPDGDRIKILVNDQEVVSNLLLIAQFRGLELPLVEGFNKIDFIALNQGESGPNTAEVQIYNSKGQLQAANRWNLATGVKATYVIIKE